MARLVERERLDARGKPCFARSRRYESSLGESGRGRDAHSAAPQRDPVRRGGQRAEGTAQPPTRERIE